MGKATPTLHSQQDSELSLQHRLLACKALLLPPGPGTAGEGGCQGARPRGIGSTAETRAQGGLFVGRLLDREPVRWGLSMRFVPRACVPRSDFGEKSRSSLTPAYFFHMRNQEQLHIGRWR